jgi:3-deoxy-D-manno-octulosonic-acid transferase
MPWSVNNWLNAIKPSLVWIVETETWPGFYAMCKKRGIPVILVNGRISPRSFRRFQRMRARFGKALSQASLILAQSKEEAQRYRDLTGGAVPIEVTGNLKFDGLKPVDPNQQAELRRALNLPQGELVLVGGSTHEGEETALLRALRTLKQDGLKARLILAPRHPERFSRVAELVEQQGMRARHFSREEAFEQEDDVYILDAIGHLTKYYSLASISFVGGTLVPVGGHNLVEPSVYGVPVVCGPHIFKTRDVARALAEKEAIMLAQDETGVVENILTLAQHPEMRARIGGNGQAYLQRSSGAVDRALAAMEQFSCQWADNGAAHDMAATKR